ncbi:phage tail tape measure protein [Pseudarthrobacter psychrotolerans]|uniref:Phage tail tape measure protein n=1 Tax=Pseudarthrobacter psychrotolerans TaxID=2697569 RepID=A0A6P1NGI2_9MICC|nr:phage tail tape measure protein [Pseudarthrobacter psychrotolerans]QHK19396.1 phage tail tape measure protein [Pseudarthrobacter psychrotolerans]
MSDKFLTVRIRAEIADFRAQMAEVSKLTRDAGKAAEETSTRASTGLGQMVQSANKHKDAWDQTGKALLGFGAAVSVGVGLAIKSYMEFDKAMSEVKAATHASAGDMELLRGAAIKAGADTAYSAKEAAGAITELAKAGVSTKDILSGGLDGALSLAAAGSIEVADAAELAATAMVQFKLSGDQIPHLADLLAAGAGKAQGSVQDLGMALKQGGLIAASTGLSIEETTGGLAAFASAGLIGSDAGTSFKTMLQSLTPNSAQAASEMQRLGISAYDQQGKFIGLSKFAGVLQGSLRGVSDESRNASLKIIFGSDAVRAANVLYEQGAKGIADWTAKVNDSGYAATTAAIKQDNLAGDIEKVGGSLDSVFLKSGSGANEVLRSLAQSADRFLGVIGDIPAPILQAGLGMAAVAGGSALLGGAFLTTFPRILETKRAFSELAESSPKLAGGLGKVTKAAGIAAVALVALEAAGAAGKAIFGKASNSAEDFAQSLLTLSGGTKDLDALFRDGGLGTQINGVGDALARMSDKNAFDDFGIWIGDLTPAGSKLNTLRDNIRGLDSTLVALVQNGGAQKAADAFRIAGEEADKSAKAQGRSGVSTAEVLKLMPQYSDAIKAQATALGVKLTQQELEEAALGKIPAKIAAVTKTTEGAAAAQKFQAAASEEAAKKLADMGLSADGTVVSLSKLLDVMFATGLATMSARDAESKYQETLDGLKVKIDGVNASQSAGNHVWDEAKGSFDLTSESGRAANGVFGDLEQAAINTTKAMANAGATQPELQDKLGKTYTSLYDTARAFGASKDKADDLARSALGIPKNVPIDVAIQNYADTMAKAYSIQGAINGITGRSVDVIINHINRQVGGGGSPDDPSMTALTPGSLSRYTGGLVGFAGGGKVPGIPPMNKRLDNVIARTQNGTPYGIRSGEWIINEPQSKANDKWLRAINDGLNLDTVFAAQAAPSKSMAGGYGQTQSFGGYNGQLTAATPAAAPMIGDIYVQNPFTGEYMLAQMDTRAGAAITKADAQTRFMRRGRS